MMITGLSIVLCVFFFILFLLEYSLINLLICYAMITWILSLIFYLLVDSFKMLIPLWLVLSTGLFVIFGYMVSLDDSKSNLSVRSCLVSGFISTFSYMLTDKMILKQNFSFTFSKMELKAFHNGVFYSFFEVNPSMIITLTVFLIIMAFLVTLYLSLLGSKGRGLRKMEE